MRHVGDSKRRLLWITVWDNIHSMATIQIVLDSALLRAADRAAKRARINRSALIRNALREHLRQSRNRELEALDREGYAKWPDTFDTDWEREASWPPE